SAVCYCLGITAVDPSTSATARLDGAADATVDVDRDLRGVAGLTAMVGRHELIAAITARLDQLDAAIATADATLESGEVHGAELEATNAALVRLR
ncbi:MAG TPA: hypothetical protein PLV68_18005, partial [Ilumatobacteraceae bacterium]|nr:hypothetical protein [Ilumatobacteraceae bacterium]